MAGSAGFWRIGEESRRRGRSRPRDLGQGTTFRLQCTVLKRCYWYDWLIPQSTKKICSVPRRLVSSSMLQPNGKPIFLPPSLLPTFSWGRRDLITRRAKVVGCCIFLLNYRGSHLQLLACGLCEIRPGHRTYLR